MFEERVCSGRANCIPKRCKSNLMVLKLHERQTQRKHSHNTKQTIVDRLFTLLSEHELRILKKTKANMTNSLTAIFVYS